MMKTYWLSFTDGDRPKGDQFVGACIVDIDDDDIADAKIDVDLRFPDAKKGSECIAAAVRKAHLMGCNPGGSVLCVEIPEEAIQSAPVELMKDRLMSFAELQALGYEPERV